jgi:hypothetical protein
MIKPVPGARVTARYDQPRPLSNPGQHIHGATDYAALAGSKIIAPEEGLLYYYIAQRPESRPTWELKIEGVRFPFSNYFYDTFGGIIILSGASGMVHLFAHCYINQLYNKGIIESAKWRTNEQSDEVRWPITTLHTLGTISAVEAGDTIGFVGNAGYSTGPHVHAEIHNGWEWTDYSDRADPETIYKG